jgi:hypothetical protein
LGYSWFLCFDYSVVILLLFCGYFYKQELQKQYQVEIELSKNVLEKEISFLKTQNVILNKTVSSLEQDEKMLSAENKALVNRFSESYKDYRNLIEKLDKRQKIIDSINTKLP